MPKLLQVRSRNTRIRGRGLRRSPQGGNKEQKTYLLGKRYKEEKKAVGENQYTAPVKVEDKPEEKKQVVQDNSNSLKSLPHFEAPIRTSQKIAEQVNVSPKTVRNAEKFTEAVDTIAKTTGVSPQKILSNEALLKL